MPNETLAEAVRWRALNTVEVLSASSPHLAKYIVKKHEQGIQKVISRAPGLGQLNRIGIVGGGLFPRTVLALERLFPEAELVVVDKVRSHLNMAKRALTRRGVSLDRVELCQGVFPDHAPALRDCDLIILPLALTGDRRRYYQSWSGAPLLIHDWVWRQQGGASAVISLAFLKRLNLVLPEAA